jgi:DNA-binding NarL/FixJ family response regulator
MPVNLKYQTSDMSFRSQGSVGPGIPQDAIHADAMHDDIDPPVHHHRSTDGPAIPMRSDVICVGLVDSFVFTRNCLMEAFLSTQHGITMKPFETITALALADARDIDVILYYDHDNTRTTMRGPMVDSVLPDAFVGIPIIVLSDDAAALDPHTIRTALKSGLRGFMSTRTIEMRTVSAAIRFVRAGGVFAPVDLLIGDEEDHQPAQDAPDTASPPPGLLTPRQLTVLSHLQQGKANKIIAFELGMSESTVKVHIRNIMRKMGATNRTQALYKLQQISCNKAPAQATAYR